MVNDDAGDSNDYGDWPADRPNQRIHRKNVRDTMYHVTSISNLDVSPMENVTNENATAPTMLPLVGS